MFERGGQGRAGLLAILLCCYLNWCVVFVINSISGLSCVVLCCVGQCCLQTVYGDLLVSHDEHGVYLSSSQPSDAATSDISPSCRSTSPVPFATNNHSSTQPESGLRKAFASAAAAAMSSPSSVPSAASGAVPNFISGLFRHPDCTDLGRVLIGRYYFVLFLPPSCLNPHSPCQSLLCVPYSTENPLQPH